MTKENEVYKCSICGNVVEVLHPAMGELVCCAKPMMLLTENTEDAALEKHVPVFELSDGKVSVKVGNVLHPMDDDHYIEWIEVIADGKVYRQDLKPGDAPEAEFVVGSETVEVRAYCNLHGLWKG